MPFPGGVTRPARESAWRCNIFFLKHTGKRKDLYGSLRNTKNWFGRTLIVEAERIHMPDESTSSIPASVLRALVIFSGLAITTFAEPAQPFLSPTNIFAPA